MAMPIWIKKNMAAEKEALKNGIPVVAEIVAAQQIAPTIGPTKKRLAGRAKLRTAQGAIADAKQISSIVHSGKLPSLVVAIKMPSTKPEIRIEIIAVRFVRLQLTGGVLMCCLVLLSRFLKACRVDRQPARKEK